MLVWLRNERTQKSTCKVDFFPVRSRTVPVELPGVRAAAYGATLFMTVGATHIAMLVWIRDERTSPGVQSDGTCRATRRARGSVRRNARHTHAWSQP